MYLLLKGEFAQEFVQNHWRREQKAHFRVTCVAQKRGCLNSLKAPLTRHQLIYVSTLE